MLDKWKRYYINFINPLTLLAGLAFLLALYFRIVPVYAFTLAAIIVLIIGIPLIFVNFIINLLVKNWKIKLGIQLVIAAYCVLVIVKNW